MQGQKICVCALAGALLFGAGDWLLGFVSPEPVAGAFYFISEGHGADFAPWRITATLLCSVVAAPLFCYALSHTGTALCGSAACGRALDAASGLCAFGWLFLHLIVTFHVAAYGIAARMSGAMQAASFSGRLDSLLRPVLFASYACRAPAFIATAAAILAGKTRLKKQALLSTPLFPMLITGTISMLLPQSAFSKGLYTFCMNCGMIVWYVYLWAASRRSGRTQQNKGTGRN